MYTMRTCISKTLSSKWVGSNFKRTLSLIELKKKKLNVLKEVLNWRVDT